jgi:Holliday junction resolvasome RuvABC DNA-binding subunit
MDSPKYNLRQKLFAVQIIDKKILEIDVDEIVINIFGIAYRNFVSETEMYQFPEKYCFPNKEMADEFLDGLN